MIGFVNSFPKVAVNFNLLLKRLYVGGGQISLFYMYSKDMGFSVAKKSEYIWQVDRKPSSINDVAHSSASYNKPRPKHSRLEVRNSVKGLWSFHHPSIFSLRSNAFSYSTHQQYSDYSILGISSPRKTFKSLLYTTTTRTPPTYRHFICQYRMTATFGTFFISGDTFRLHNNILWFVLSISIMK